MTVIEQYMALPALDMSHIREYFDTHLKDKIDGLAFCLYYPSFNDGDSCEIKMFGMIPLFADRTPSSEEIDSIASDTKFSNLCNYLKQRHISANIFDEISLECDMGQWFSLEGKHLKDGDYYLGWDYDGLDEVGRYPNPDRE
jgi:hypothetical protein